MASILTGLPSAVKDKINKTKQTRGAQPYERVPYQNRVNRNSIAVVPYAFRNRLHPDGFESGYRILVRPSDYFHAAGVPREDFDSSVRIGDDAFVYYDNRREWISLPPDPTWVPCEDRSGDGHYIARVPATVAAEGAAVVEGVPQGIRFFEYASSEEIRDTVAQLAWLAWNTDGIDNVSAGPPQTLIDYLDERQLRDAKRLVAIGAVEPEPHHRAICPLCLQVITLSGLMSRVVQAEGREVVDLTTTEVNLFHLRDLRPGEYNHVAYGLAWGHHHCNAAARDHGIEYTLDWMESVLRRHGRPVARP